MRSLAAALLCAAGVVAACRPATAPAPAAVPPALAGAEQIIVVTTPGWDSTTGVLHRFERASPAAPWRATGAPAPVVVGRTGLAWGVGFDAVDASEPGAAPHKREGDGRSPAGVFPLDTTFGFAPRDSMTWLRTPYAPLTPESDCVDDTASVHYNTVVPRNLVPRVDWASAEHMRRIDQYRIGVIVGYNASPVVRGRGSCIFLHIWEGPRSTTAGCTAFDATYLQQVMAWLDPRKRPALVQLPAAQYARLRAHWGLPSFE